MNAEETVHPNMGDTNKLFEKFAFPKVETTLKLDTPPIKPPHSKLIIELTGKFVAGMLIGPYAVDIDKKGINNCIELAEETIKQLKQKGYIK
jgi:hypothetical protein